MEKQHKPEKTKDGGQHASPKPKQPDAKDAPAPDNHDPQAQYEEKDES